MNKKPKKVLMVAGRMVYGGLETMLMNWYRNIDSQKVHIDFMLHYEQKGVFDDEIKHGGSKIFVMPRLKPKNLFKYINAVNNFFKEHKGEYDIVHGHLTSVGIIYLTIARFYGVKTRIIHAHYGNVIGNHYEFLERIMLKPLRWCANYYFACSDKAGRFCYGNRLTKGEKYRIIKNGIDICQFSFDEEKRSILRKKYELEDKQVILHVGRFESEKNHKFIIDLFREYVKMHYDSILILVGKGSLEEEITKKITEYGIEENVINLHTRSDVNDIMQMADVFILPSIFEGLPVVGIESQASGLYCLFSDTVTRELDITGNCEFLPLSSKKPWMDALEKSRSFERNKTDDKIIESGYEIHSQSKWLEDFYLTH